MDEWIEGLPTEEGRYYYAIWLPDWEEWKVDAGGAARRQGVLEHDVYGLMIADYTDVKHKPAPLLPEPPS